jgi:hypothetical protein
MAKERGKNKDLEARSFQVYPNNESMRSAWLRNAIWLREKSKAGYALDKKVEKKAQTAVLHRPPVEPIVTVASLPDEQVVPPAPNVSKGPWRKTK